VHPSCNRKSGTGNPPPTAGAPALDPTFGGIGRVIADPTRTADALQRPLVPRFRFRVRLSASVGLTARRGEGRPRFYKIRPYAFFIVVMLGDRMGLLTLQEIFCTSSPDSERTHPLPSHVRRAARAIMPCRTAALGGPSHACPDGPMSRIWSNACRHRACPPCASLQTARWWALQQARLLPCAHSQVLFTLPHALKPLWRANVSALPTLGPPDPDAVARVHPGALLARCGRRTLSGA
jgi:Transposase zinc-binding domain